MDMFTKRCLITHTDLDGYVCRFIAEILTKYSSYKFDEIVHVDYKTVPEVYDIIDDFDEFVFADMSPTIEVYKEMKAKRKMVLIYDHHDTFKTTVDEGNIRVFNYFYDENKCGAKIMYEELYLKYMQPHKFLSDLVYQTDVYDLWQTEHIDWELGLDLNRIFAGYRDFKVKYNQYGQFLKMQHSKYQRMTNWELLDNEKELVKKAKDAEDLAYEKAKKTVQKRVDGQGNFYLYFKSRSRISYFSWLLLRDNKDVVYSVGKNTYDSKSDSYSLRSRKGQGFFVNKICEGYGGGGHLHAGGLLIEDKTLAIRLDSGVAHLI